MNQQTKKELDALITRLVAIKEEVDELTGPFSDMASVEQEKFDNLSEGLQQAESGTKIGEAADALTEADNTLNSISDELDGLISTLNDL